MDAVKLRASPLTSREDEPIITLLSITGADVKVLHPLHLLHLTHGVVVVHQILTVKLQPWIVTHRLDEGVPFTSAPETQHGH